MRSNRMVIILTLVQFLVNGCHFCLGQSSKFAFKFAGYKKQNGVFNLKECPQNAKDNFAATKTMIDEALRLKNALEMPIAIKDKTHVECVRDAIMGNVVKFTIYKVDNHKGTGKEDRQRMEMKGKEQGENGTTFLYAWWLKLDPKMKNSDSFYHIFQIKAEGSKAMSKFALATLTLTNKNQFHLQLNNLNKYGKNPHKLLNLHEVKGKWIQVLVEAVYKTKSQGGRIRVTMKDEKGKDLVKEKTFQHEMMWISASQKKANFRPKWGLYRNKSAAYQPSDWQLFQNIQIWKKI